METKNIIEIAKEWEEGKRYVAVNDLIPILKKADMLDICEIIKELENQKEG